MRQGCIFINTLSRAASEAAAVSDSKSNTMEPQRFICCWMFCFQGTPSFIGCSSWNQMSYSDSCHPLICFLLSTVYSIVNKKERMWSFWKSLYMFWYSCMRHISVLQMLVMQTPLGHRQKVFHLFVWNLSGWARNHRMWDKKGRKAAKELTDASGGSCCCEVSFFLPPWKKKKEPASCLLISAFNFAVNATRRIVAALVFLRHVFFFLFQKRSVLGVRGSGDGGKADTGGRGRVEPAGQRLDRSCWNWQWNVQLCATTTPSSHNVSLQVHTVIHSNHAQHSCLSRDSGYLSVFHEKAPQGPSFS